MRKFIPQWFQELTPFNKLNAVAGIAGILGLFVMLAQWYSTDAPIPEIPSSQAGQIGNSSTIDNSENWVNKSRNEWKVDLSTTHNSFHFNTPAKMEKTSERVIQPQETTQALSSQRPDHEQLSQNIDNHKGDNIGRDKYQTGDTVYGDQYKFEAPSPRTSPTPSGRDFDDRYSQPYEVVDQQEKDRKQVDFYGCDRTARDTVQCEFEVTNQSNKRFTTRVMNAELNERRRGSYPGRTIRRSNKSTSPVNPGESVKFTISFTIDPDYEDFDKLLLQISPNYGDSYFTFRLPQSREDRNSLKYRDEPSQFR